MKITKEQLLYMFAELGAIYEGTPTGTLYGHALYDALKNDNLEIDGFERVEWTKFDPDNPETFPPLGLFLSYGDLCGEKRIITAGRGADTDTYCFADVYRDMTHWRPLPKPPQESEAGK